MTQPLARHLLTASVLKDEPMRVLVFSDTHLPYADAGALRIVLKALCTYKPDEVILAGDIVDFYGISRYLKDPSRRASIQQDIDDARELLSRIRHLLPSSKMVYIEGNHELRMHKDLCRRAVEYKDLRALELPSLLHLREIGVQWVPEDRFYEIGPLSITHGEFANKYATNKYLTEYVTDLVAGHSHHMASRYLHTFNGTFQAHEIGCLCARQAIPYKKFPNLHHGFATADVWPEFSFAEVNLHLIQDGLCAFRGQLLDGRESDGPIHRPRRGSTRRIGRLRPV